MVSRTRLKFSRWVVREKSMPRSEQLQGKVLAITRHGSSTHFLTLFVLEKYGLQDKVKIQPMGGTREVDAEIGAASGKSACYHPPRVVHAFFDAVCSGKVWSPGQG